MGPNFGIGVYFRGESFYFGLSSPKILKDRTNNGEFASLERTSYFFNGGYLMDVNKSVKFKPSFLIKYNEGAPLSAHLSSMFLINEYLWLGASYRLSDSVDLSKH